MCWLAKVPVLFLFTCDSLLITRLLISFSRVLPMRDPGTVCYNLDEKTRYKILVCETWLQYASIFCGPTEQTICQTLLES